MKVILKAGAAAFILSFVAGATWAQRPSEAWNPDKGSHYINPVINADYSDPDVCRVGEDFYMTSSSFGCFPGLQILHSTDLVNWEIVGAALTDYPGPNWSDERSWETLGQKLDTPADCPPGAEEWRTVPQHGNAVWAPAIRYHDGEFYIYCGDPDRGIFMVKASDPRGRWEDPVWVVKAKGFIDPCPFWDEDGKAYLSHGCAGSRAGHKSVLFVAEMAPDGTRLLERSRIVYDGHETQPTIEGTKFYRKDGYYYIFSPAGGVPTGWQVVLRSKSPYGPYEERVVMAQGNSPVNGPHQGAWVDTPKGEHWFLHFQDKDAYGRVVHLQPMTWTDEGWPVIGTDSDGDGVGEPVMRYRKPDLKSSGIFQPAESDDFTSVDLGLQWQWHGVPSPYWYYMDASARETHTNGLGALRLYSVDQKADWRNLGDSPNLLLQKTPADKFTVTAKVRFIPNPQLKERGESCGLVMMGLDYAALKLVDTADGVMLQYVECHDALKGSPETVLASTPLESAPLPTPYSNRYMSTTVPPVAPLAYKAADVFLRLKVEPRERRGNVPEAVCTFWYSLDGKKWTQLSTDTKDGSTSKGKAAFVAAPGKWIGAKFGFFCNRLARKNDSGWMQIDWVRVTE
ncbi:MAG: glycoside hydrolase 43 family protein [Bacteroidales bacterium]|nr:glycoside hydrolase 43 family protein [Bacteroidales bacterium]